MAEGNVIRVSRLDIGSFIRNQFEYSFVFYSDRACRVRNVSRLVWIYCDRINVAHCFESSHDVMLRPLQPFWDQAIPLVLFK